MVDNKKTEKRLKAIEQSIVHHDEKKLQQAIGPCLPADERSIRPMVQALYRGILQASSLFKENRSSVPELLLSIDTFHTGLGRLKQGTPDASAHLQDPKGATVVIGVIEGDIHDMGKNIVAALLEASGYEVIDLGRNAAKAAFLHQIKEVKASVLAISTMISTTLENVADLIGQAKRNHPELIVLVGGAPFDDHLARSMGADGYAENATHVPQELEKIMQGTSGD